MKIDKSIANSRYWQYENEINALTQEAEEWALRTDLDKTYILLWLGETIRTIRPWIVYPLAFLGGVYFTYLMHSSGVGPGWYVISLLAILGLAIAVETYREINPDPTTLYEKLVAHRLLTTYELRENAAAAMYVLCRDRELCQVFNLLDDDFYRLRTAVLEHRVSKAFSETPEKDEDEDDNDDSYFGGGYDRGEEWRFRRRSGLYGVPTGAYRTLH